MKFRSLRDTGNINSRYKATAIGTVAAVNENGWLGLSEQVKQVFQLGGRHFAPSRKLIVDKLNPGLPRRFLFAFVPVLTRMGAAEVDNCLDAIAFVPCGDLLRRRLRGAIEPPSDDRMEVPR